MKFVFVLVAIIILIPGQEAYGDPADDYTKCMQRQKIKDKYFCLDEVGRDAWVPLKEGGSTAADECTSIKVTLGLATKMKMNLSYKLLYFNERCRRLSLPHFKR